ncbi:MAG: di-trans,poly-cis-decaprenylcistransferase [Spirochaetes bacterium]|nr:di-trans,poly-cis-decaprenylcistransferase [Spirochaetota bacterium]
MTLDKKRIPAHIAIILDGNRRWARKKGFPPMEGHRRGMENVERIVKFSKEIGIKAISVYAFSTENWERAKDEIKFIMDMVDRYFNKNYKKLKEQGIRIIHSGRMRNLTSSTRRAIRFAVKETKMNYDIIFNICFNYGGQQEIIDGIKKMNVAIKKKKFSLARLNEKTFKQFMYNPELPDPDLVIRTSGEVRTSNFLLWESAYSEWYFSPLNWPDFKEKDLVLAIKEYQSRERRWGK